MRYWLRPLGISLTIIFGGGFLIRLLRDGDFYIAEFIGGIIGIILLLIRLFIAKKDSKQIEHLSDNLFVKKTIKKT